MIVRRAFDVVVCLSLVLTAISVSCSRISNTPIDNLPASQPIVGEISRGFGENPEVSYAVVRVYFATNRKVTGLSVPENFYGSDASALTLGHADVSIPRDHRMGAMERPAVLAYKGSEDPAKYVMLMKVEPTAEALFYSMIRSRVARSQGKAAFVFVHGFNVSFADAARRTAQLAYDIGYDGAPTFFSWPSAGVMSTNDYWADEKKAKEATESLKTYLLDLHAKTGVEQIHLIAHSMGNIVTTQALSELSQSLPADVHFKISQLVLAAPDLDAETFKTDIAPAMKKMAQRVTLYVSARDRALVFSRGLHNNKFRIGEAGKGMTLLDGIDTVDVSQLDTDFIGHSYYGENVSIISDIFLLFGGLPPAQRKCLDVMQDGALSYWRFRPACVGRTHE